MFSDKLQTKININLHFSTTNEIIIKIPASGGSPSGLYRDIAPGRHWETAVPQSPHAWPWPWPWPWFNPHPSGCIGPHSDAILICYELPPLLPPSDSNP